jgi:zinc transport system ATP-binding protein
MEENYKIEIKNLNFGYKGHPSVLENVNVKIKENQIITVVGPNGGGKTTLLKLITGLLRPDSGEILIDGKPCSKYTSIGYVPQHSHFDGKFPITVYEVVLSGRIRPFGYYNKKDKLVADKCIEEVGLNEFKDKAFSALSGGQKQRVLIARALATEAKILLLDEPTSNIDSEIGRNLNSLLKRLGSRMTIILVTHDTGFVTNITDRVLCINRKVVEHPVDSNFSDIVSSAYSSQSVLVRHDIEISNNSEERI